MFCPTVARVWVFLFGSVLASKSEAAEVADEKHPGACCVDPDVLLAGGAASELTGGLGVGSPSILLNAVRLKQLPSAEFNNPMSYPY